VTSKWPLKLRRQDSEKTTGWTIQGSIPGRGIRFLYFIIKTDHL
jgi:hypothetical protein